MKWNESTMYEEHLTTLFFVERAFLLLCWRRTRRGSVAAAEGKKTLRHLLDVSFFRRTSLDLRSSLLPAIDVRLRLLHTDKR